MRETGNAAVFPDAQATAGRRLLDQEDLRQAARRRRDGVLEGPSRSSASPSTTRWPTTRAGRIDRPDREEPPKPGRRPDPHQLPQAVRELGLGVRASCDRLLQKLLAFVEVHSETDAEKKRLRALEAAERRHPRLRERSSTLSARRRGRRRRRRRRRTAGAARRRSSSSTATSTTSTRSSTRPSSTSTRSSASSTRRASSSQARRQAPEADPAAASRRSSPTEKVLIFTEFADTARYLDKHSQRRASTASSEIDSCEQDEPRRRDPPLRALLQRLQLGGARRRWQGRDPRPRSPPTSSPRA